jgi:CBS domain-containing protein
MIKVLDFMSADVITTDSEADIKPLIKKMVLCGITGMPVVNNEGIMVGIISIVDIVEKAYPSVKEFYDNPLSFSDFSEIEKNVLDFERKKVKDFMREKVFTVSPEDSLLKAFSYMHSKGVGRIPVMKDGKPVGIVDMSDIFHGVIVEKLDIKVDLKDLYRKRTKTVKHQLN